MHIIRMKHNNPEVDCLKLLHIQVNGGDDDDGWDHNIWTRLEHIISENEYVESVKLDGCLIPTCA